MAGSGARPPVGGLSPSGEGRDFTRREAAEYIASLFEGLHAVAHGAQMPFLNTSCCPCRCSLSRTWAQRADALGAGAGLVLAFANARLLASHEPADIVDVANIKKNREQQEQRSDSPLPRQREHA